VSACACLAGTRHGRLPGTEDNGIALNVLPDGTASQAQWQSWGDRRCSGRAAVMGPCWQPQWAREVEHELIVHADQNQALNETLHLMKGMQCICTACIHCCASLQSEPTGRNRRH